MSLVKSTDSSLTSEATLNIGLAAPQIIVDEHLSAHCCLKWTLFSFYFFEGKSPTRPINNEDSRSGYEPNL